MLRHGEWRTVEISIHAPHAGRDGTSRLRHASHHISIHAPHAGRDTTSTSSKTAAAYFNPRAPCGARPVGRGTVGAAIVDFNPRAPCGARLPREREQHHRHHISIHAPHAGRDSKSIQNYFKHFCDKRQFLDNFTQNTAFQSVLPLADRQKLLYLRCEPLRKFLRAFASHYKIIGSSGR